MLKEDPGEGVAAVGLGVTRCQEDESADNDNVLELQMHPTLPFFFFNLYC